MNLVILLFLNQQLLVVAATIMSIKFKSHLLCLYPSRHLADLPLRQSVCRLLQHLVNFDITPELNCNFFSLILSIKIILFNMHCQLHERCNFVSI